MLFNAATLLTLATAAFALPNHEKRTVDPAVASIDLYQVLPSSLQAIARTNQAAAGTIISAEFATGTPTWFSKLDPEVQTYFLTKGAGAIPTTASAAISTGVSGSNLTATGKFSNSTTTKTAAATSDLSAATSTLESAGASSRVSASSTSAGGAMQTQIVGAGLAGALGLVGLFAL